MLTLTPSWLLSHPALPQHEQGKGQQGWGGQRGGRPPTWGHRWWPPHPMVLLWRLKQVGSKDVSVEFSEVHRFPPQKLYKGDRGRTFFLPYLAEQHHKGLFWPKKEGRNHFFSKKWLNYFWQSVASCIIQHFFVYYKVHRWVFCQDNKTTHSGLRNSVRGKSQLDPIPYGLNTEI